MFLVCSLARFFIAHDDVPCDQVLPAEADKSAPTGVNSGQAGDGSPLLFARRGVHADSHDHDLFQDA
jgi:hypothetical protein